MIEDRISDEEVAEFLEESKNAMLEARLPEEIAKGARIEIVHPEYWEVKLFVPMPKTRTMKAAEVRKAVEKAIFGKCGVRDDECDYIPPRRPKNECGWYFNHPAMPQVVRESIWREKEEAYGSEIGLGLPIPSGAKSKSDTAFITVKDEYYREIESGRKTTEFRMLNQYYCDKFFSPGVKKRFVKINRGYQSGEGNQMVFEIAGIDIVSYDGLKAVSAVDEEGKPLDSFSKLPRDFAPAEYAIHLGKRIR